MDDDTIAALRQQVPPCTPLDFCGAVVERFRDDPGLHAQAVVSHGAVIGLIRRSDFLGAFTGPYAYSLLHDRILAQWLAQEEPRPVVAVDLQGDLEEAADLLGGDPAPDHCLVVLDGGRYAGLLARDAVLTGLLARARRQTVVLAQARDEALQAAEAKSVFLATMSHEIRTPLTGILGCCQILQELGLDHDQAEMARLVEQSGRGLLNLLNDLIDEARLEVGRVVLHPAPFDLEECVALVVGLMRGPAAAKGIDVRLLPGPGVPRRVLGDETRLRQILCNLVGNATKFTQQGVVLVRTGLGEGGMIDLQVIDTGPGIAPESLGRLFLPFSQVDAGMGRHHGGAGLGLSICRQLAELMGGRITVASVPGRGSLFTVTLPLPALPDPGGQEDDRPVTITAPGVPA